ncbi:hypothetical protein [Ferribacterium limneticum]|uniref:hypothetical protein n=1 Tax=Ferribacterium limneticum TaxID=76259 RepID=UPI001CF96DAC|nr:hypothetical protein [Ferribacterium limneticum]UCV19255.1 hypothetical protein KI610_01310 [Ferribacterium limneticum]
MMGEVVGNEGLHVDGYLQLAEILVEETNRAFQGVRYRLIWRLLARGGWLKGVELLPVGVDQPNLLPFPVACFDGVEILVNICQLVTEKQRDKSFRHAIDMPFNQAEIAFFRVANRIRYPGELQESANQRADQNQWQQEFLAKFHGRIG